jgi:DNA invertase Pin-like site-specific DNA recombinase
VLAGYARVSTAEQNLDLQKDALTKAGCEKIFTDVASGAASEREGLKEALDYVRSGDVLVVWRLDRLGRSLQHLLETINGLQERGIGFKSVSESLDTTTSGGKLVFQIFGALAEFERNLIRERTRAGLDSARARGRLGGRPRLLDPNKAALAKKLYEEKNHTIEEICELIGVSKPSLYHYLRGRHKEKAAICI